METGDAAKRTAAEVRAAMARQRITQMAAATHLGISLPAMSRRLRGVVAFDIDELASIAELLDVPTSTLVVDEPEQVSA